MTDAAAAVLPAYCLVLVSRSGHSGPSCQCSVRYDGSRSPGTRLLLTRPLGAQPGSGGEVSPIILGSDSRPSRSAIIFILSTGIWSENHRSEEVIQAQVATRK